MTKRIVLINGPARSGKDTVGQMIARIVGDVQVAKFAHTLKCGTHALFHGLHDAWASADETTNSDNGRACRDDAHYESRKGEPLPRFYGLSPREAYIAVSEIFAKVVYGPNIFGDLLVPILEQNPAPLAVITDSGFQDEAEVLQERFGAENVFVIRLSRMAYSFDEKADPTAWLHALSRCILGRTPAKHLLRTISDSRHYITLTDSKTFNIRNNGGMPELEQAVRLALTEFGFPA